MTGAWLVGIDMSDGDDERSAQRRRRGAWVPTFESTDAEATEAFLTVAYDMPIRINNVGSDYRFRLARLGSGPLHLVTIDHTPSTDTYSDPLPEYLVVVRVDSGTRTNVDADDRLGPGDFSLYSQPGQAVHFHAASIQQTMVMVPMQAARDAASNRPADDLGALRFDSMRPTHPAAGRRWLRTVDFVADTLLAFPDTMAQPLLSGATSRLLAATLLTTFPNSWITEPQHHDRTDATPTTLTRAIDFIQANANLDISVVDIARASHVTIRAVQLAFRRHLNTTPMTYLRRVRLQSAHEQLRAAHPSDGTTITDIAARWGFADPSRFAALYRRTYGRLPSDTLRN
jgi:AraC-like DNA-binding protein